MTWWRRVWRRSQLEQQLDKELRFHIEEHTADLIARGHHPDEARRIARLALGGPEQVKEGCRDARGTRWLEDLAQDVRYALRTLRQNPAFAAVALCTLALGIGATTVMFTVINGVLLKPLPYPEPDRLIAVYSQMRNQNRPDISYVANLDFRDFQRETRTAAIEGWLFGGGTVSEPGDPAYVDEREISAGLFPLLGVSMFRGRTFLPEEDRPGAPHVAIIGYSFWQHQFAGSPGAIGSTLVFDTRRYTVVGIARPDLRLGGEEGDLYTPLGQDTAAYLQNRRAHPVRVIARLRPGATLPQAQAELALIGSRLEKHYPDTNAGRIFDVRPLRPEVGDVRATLWLLLGAVSLVLLIACVNVASLLLARAVSRDRELAMRVVLGAGRGRLVRQALTESAVLGLAGGVLGVLVAKVGVRPFLVFWPGSLPRAYEVQLDRHVLLFAIAVSLLSGVLFGLAPAVRVPLRQLEQTLRAGSRTVASSSRRLHGVFVISEIALAVVLLVSAGMLGRTMLRLSSLDPGVNVRNVLVARMALSPSTLTDAARTRAAWDDILERGRHVPGVEAVAAVDTIPMRQGYNQNGYWTTAAVPPENEQPVALSTSVTPDYFKVMNVPLRQGRFFNGSGSHGQSAGHHY